MLAIPSGNQVIRLLPPLNLQQTQAEEGTEIIRRVTASVA
jgi:acetylornithine/succinyldiaminopimelate/putrescine aminotransferase